MLCHNHRPNLLRHLANYRQVRQVPARVCDLQPVHDQVTPAQGDLVQVPVGLLHRDCPRRLLHLRELSQEEQSQGAPHARQATQGACLPYQAL